MVGLDDVGGNALVEVLVVRFAVRSLNEDLCSERPLLGNDIDYMTKIFRL